MTEIRTPQEVSESTNSLAKKHAAIMKAVQAGQINDAILALSRIVTTDVARLLWEVNFAQASGMQEIAKNITELGQAVVEKHNEIEDRIDGLEAHPLLIVAEASDLSEPEVLDKFYADVQTVMAFLVGTELSLTTVGEEKLADVVTRVSNNAILLRAGLSVTLDAESEGDEDEGADEDEGGIEEGEEDDAEEAPDAETATPSEVQ